MSRYKKNKSQEEEEIEELTKILINFAVGCNPDINKRESFDVVYDELVNANLSELNATRLGTLCRLTVGTPNTTFDH